MPLEHFLKDALSGTLNHVSMAGNDALKVPLADPGHALRESRAVPLTRPIPDCTLLPNC